MAAQERPYQPSLPWRLTSTVNIGVVGFLTRSFLYGLNRTETRGLDRFLEILDARKDEKTRTRGLITVSNHDAASERQYRLDDPMMWGVLPNRYFWNPSNMRWSLGSYDICFKNRFMELFFTYGNTLPTHRAAYSKYGGIFQPTMTQAIRLLSDPHGSTAFAKEERDLRPPFAASLPATDPFTSAELTYTTSGSDVFPAPAVYPSRRFSWVHIFPEGMIYQHPEKSMRYFKWGVARLILEAEPCPDVLPIWIDGPQRVMDDRRPWPRPLPRPGKDISVTFGDLVNRKEVFEPFRQKWHDLKIKAQRKKVMDSSNDARHGDNLEQLGVLNDDELQHGPEAEQLRIEVTLAVRDEVLKVRRACGLPEEDPKRAFAETWLRGGNKEGASWVGDQKPDEGISSDW